ncbi:MAG: LysR family transcriptional regulator, partial [Atopobium sp.]|nr:LysR family transcriptional regulator [Atopobium sp.]
METNLHKFQAFTSAAYHSSFTVAAEELGCTQSSISRMVASLEKEWDVRLFNRHGGYVSLTPEGKTLLPVAEEVCQAYSKLSNQVNRVSAIEMGNLVIAAPSSFLSRALPGHLK